MVRDNRIVDAVTNDSYMLDSQLLNRSRITDDVMFITEDISPMDSDNNISSWIVITISPWIVIITSCHW